jgi:hypothetical protein
VKYDAGVSRLPPLVTIVMYVDLAFLGLLCLALIMAVLSGGAWAILPCLAFGGLVVLDGCCLDLRRWGPPIRATAAGIAAPVLAVFGARHGPVFCYPAAILQALVGLACLYAGHSPRAGGRRPPREPRR